MAVPEHVSVTVPIEDVGAPEDIRRIAEEESRTPIDLAHGPMVRARLLRSSEREHTLLLTLHHIAFDGSSRGIFAHELETLYNAFHAGNSSPLPPPSLRYADYAQWQRNEVSRESVTQRLLGLLEEAASRVFQRRSTLPDRQAMVRLPSAFRGDTKAFVLPVRVRSRKEDLVIDLAKQRRSSLFMVTLAAFQVLLAKYSLVRTTLLTGVPVAARDRPELEGLIGLLANELTLRLKLAPGATFLDLLAQARETCLDAFEHQDIPFDKLVLELNPERQLSRNPLFQVLFSLRTNVLGSLHLDGLGPNGDQFLRWRSSPNSIFRSTSARGSRERYRAGLNTIPTCSLDAIDHVERMAEHFHTLLEAIVQRPEAPVSELPMLLDGSGSAPAARWSSTPPGFVAYPAHLCLHDVLTQTRRQNHSRCHGADLPSAAS